MGRVFRTKTFSRWMYKSDVTDVVLCRAVSEMNWGLIDAELGGYLVKKRIPLRGRGKSGGARTIVATNWRGTWFFILGYEKNEQENISDYDLIALQMLASHLLEYDEPALAVSLVTGELVEICNEETKAKKPDPWRGA